MPHETADSATLLFEEQQRHVLLIEVQAAVEMAEDYVPLWQWERQQRHARRASRGMARFGLGAASGGAKDALALLWGGPGATALHASSARSVRARAASSSAAPATTRPRGDRDGGDRDGGGGDDDAAAAPLFSDYLQHAGGDDAAGCSRVRCVAAAGGGGARAAAAAAAADDDGRRGAAARRRARARVARRGLARLAPRPAVRARG